ncbi:MAG: hypothetical protein R6U30_14925 [Halomonas sp.]|uniref:hypothetical protein n=1 Tax=Halomonas sp. TaxID=1486246 RepID=UPI003970B843
MDADHVLQRLRDIDEMDVADILDDDRRMLPTEQWSKVWWQTISGIEMAEMADESGEGRQVVGLL